MFFVQKVPKNVGSDLNKKLVGSCSDAFYTSRIINGSLLELKMYQMSTLG